MDAIIIVSVVVEIIIALELGCIAHVVHKVNKTKIDDTTEQVYGDIPHLPTRDNSPRDNSPRHNHQRIEAYESTRSAETSTTDLMSHCSQTT